MLSTFHWFGYEIPDSEVYRLIRSVGFDSTSLGWDDRNYQNFRNQPGLARKAGLAIDHIHVPYEGVNNLWLDTLDGDSFVDKCLQYVTDCAQHDLPKMVMHLSSGDQPPPYNQLGLDRVKRVVEKAEQKNINIALENLRRTEYLAYVMGNIDSPRLGFCYDSGHHNYRAAGEDLLGKYGVRLFTMHLHDNDGTADQHLLPFDGTIDWRKTMSEIKATGYNGAVSLEAANTGYKELSAEEFLQVMYDRATRLFSLKSF